MRLHIKKKKKKKRRRQIKPAIKSMSCLYLLLQEKRVKEAGEINMYACMYVYYFRKKKKKKMFLLYNNIINESNDDYLKINQNN